MSPGLSVLGEGQIVLKLSSISLSLLLLGLEVVDLLLGLLDVPDGVVGGSQLVVSELVERSLEVGLEVIKLVEHSLDNIASITKSHGFELGVVLSVVNVVVTRVSSSGDWSLLSELFE